MSKVKITIDKELLDFIMESSTIESTTYSDVLADVCFACRDLEHWKLVKREADLLLKMEN